jgi:SPP1 family predicted phage head-tail adaptor
MALIDYLTQTAIFQRYDGSLDALGHRNYADANWDNLKTVKCMVRPVSGSESVSRGKTVADNSYIVYTEYYTGLTEGDRISISGDIYNIEHIKDPNSLNDHLEIECSREV